MSPERLRDPEAMPSGAFVAVVGPSGAGKDTLMSRAAQNPALSPRVRFARRIVTRAALIGSEDHDSVDQGAFARAEADGAFCLSWAAHGLRYGLPRSIDADLEVGRTVVANISRRSLADAAVAFGRLHVVEVTTTPDVLLKRLFARGREPEDQIRSRLDRSEILTLPPGTADHLRIDNSGSVEVATDVLVDYLNRLSQPR